MGFIHGINYCSEGDNSKLNIGIITMQRLE